MKFSVKIMNFVSEYMHRPNYVTLTLNELNATKMLYLRFRIYF